MQRCLGVQNSSKIPGGQAGQHAPSPEQGPQSLSLRVRHYCTSRYVMYLPAVSLGRMIFTTCPRLIPK